MSVTVLGDRPGTTVRQAVDRFLSSKRCENPNTRRAYAGVLDRLAETVGADRALAGVTGEELAADLEAL
jgi:hypothetical protein